MRRTKTPRNRRARLFRTAPDPITGFTLLNRTETNHRMSTSRPASRGAGAAELSAMSQLHELVARLLTSPDLSTALDEVLAASIDITGAEMGAVQSDDTDCPIVPWRPLMCVTAQHGTRKNVVPTFRSASLPPGKPPPERILRNLRLALRLQERGKKVREV